MALVEPPRAALTRMAFSKAWRSYFDEEDSWLHTAAQMDQGEAYEQDLAHWHDWIGQFKCAESAPRKPDD